MNCEEVQTLIHPLVDGEFDAYHACEVEAHVESCSGCAVIEREVPGQLRDVGPLMLV